MAGTSPFQAHDANMAQWLATCQQPVNGKAGGTVVIRSAVGPIAYPASVGVFKLAQILEGGGFKNKLSGQAIVRKADLPVLPADPNPVVGMRVLVNMPGGTQRQCIVSDVEDCYTEWRFNLWDATEGG
jgi:hypothetical protein